MLCVRCGQENPPEALECSNCGALIVKEENNQDESLLDVESGYSYIYPERMYINPIVFNLVKSAFEYCQQKVDKEYVGEALKAVQTRLFDLNNEIIPEMLDTLHEYKQEEVSREYARQMIYLLNKGVKLSKEGIGRVENFLETEDFDRLVEGVFRVQVGNDYLYLAGDLMKANLQFLSEEIGKRRLTSRAEEFQAKMREAQENREALEAKQKGENPEEYLNSKASEEVLLSDDE